MKTLLKWVVRLGLGLVLLLAAIFLVAAVMPAAADTVPDPADYGAGAKSVQPSYSGLQREFPATNEPADNPTTDDKALLGRLLFFDPVLSQNNDIACASCHNPNLGFSDGKTVATGPDGTPLTRNTPGLWNVAYAQNLFWDGRLDSLEAQVEFPLTHPHEMGVDDTAALVAELAAIPEYEQLFEAVYDDAVTLDNIEKSLAAFQRTLISNNSPFDQYAAGNFEALTAQQRRGLALFRSGATRCFECHAAPTFASDTFRVVGVPSDDPGRAGVVNDGLTGAFKVPSLRNVVLTAPYMHNGSLATLEDVVDFYAEGGGRAHGADNVDVFVNGFELNAQERADLASFLYALTDESQMPEVPTAVPSGLPVVAPQPNPARELAAQINIGGSSGQNAAREPMTIRVQPGESIQTAVDRAQPGDTIEVPYGTYHERVVVDLSDITLIGVPNDAGEWPILDGEEVLTEGIISSGNNFRVGNFTVRNYTDNGVLVEGVTGVHFHDIYAENVGTYGIYPVQSSNVLVERMEVTGVDDAGIYAGQCENVTVRDSVVYGNVIGIELENTVGGEVYNNHAHDNTLGILIVLLPQLTSKVSRETKIYDNVLENNNLANFGRAGSTVSILPPGVGLLLLATDHAEAYNNQLAGNKTSGVAVFSLTGSGAFDKNEIDVGPLPEYNWVHDNSYENNGYDPDKFIKDMGIPVGDILWDGSGQGNRFNEDNATSFPPLLPGTGWPGFVQRGYGNLLTWVIGLVA
ncbi:MAG: right-handed parallel beta-helix repeat-containing protein [Ardenticatenaceae bacterium]|nr:right-handed parallel beta-helix repeat-containing protein [Ardenticatenaceae bacterium]